MRVFIDTNIFLDILCRREQFVDDALSIFDMAVDDRIDLLISDCLSTVQCLEALLARRSLLSGYTH